jgi:hypothetical protein
MPVTHGDNDQQVQDLLSKAATQQSEPSGACRVLAPSGLNAPLSWQLSPHNHFKMQSLLAALLDPYSLSQHCLCQLPPSTQASSTTHNALFPRKPSTPSHHPTCLNL